MPVSGAGRTDAGVHASARWPASVAARVAERAIRRALNASLPRRGTGTIERPLVRLQRPVPGASKTYRYVIVNGEHTGPFAGATRGMSASRWTSTRCRRPLAGWKGRTTSRPSRRRAAACARPCARIVSATVDAARPRCPAGARWPTTRAGDVRQVSPARDSSATWCGSSSARLVDVGHGPMPARRSSSARASGSPSGRSDSAGPRAAPLARALHVSWGLAASRGQTSCRSSS